MSRKLIRLVLAATVAAGFALAPLPARAAERTIVVEDDQFNGGSKNFDIYLHDTVKWELSGDAEDDHQIVPQNGRPGGNTWPDGAKPSDTLTKEKGFSFKFDKVGRFFYYDGHHQDSMEGYYIDVTDPNAPPATQPPVTQPPTTQPPTTQPPATQPPATTTTTSAPASSQGTKPPTTGGAAPTTTTAKDKKNKDDKKDDKDETTTTTVPPPPPPPVDIPDSAIIPVLPGLQGTNTTSQNGIEAPDGAPEGDAIALLKSKKGNGKAVKLLIVSGLGLGVLGFGTAGYKYANRSSKYFPA